MIGQLPGSGGNVTLYAVEVCRAGTWNTIPVSAEDFEQMVELFHDARNGRRKDIGRFEGDGWYAGRVPVVIGHEPDAQIVGDATGVHTVNGQLFADMSVIRSAAQYVAADFTNSVSVEHVTMPDGRHRLWKIALLHFLEKPAVSGMRAPRLCLPRSYSEDSSMTAASIHRHALRVNSATGELVSRQYSQDRRRDDDNDGDDDPGMALHELARQTAHDRDLDYRSALERVMADPKNAELVARHAAGTNGARTYPNGQRQLSMPSSDADRAAASRKIHDAATRIMNAKPGTDYKAAIQRALADDPETAAKWVGR